MIALAAALLVQTAVRGSVVDAQTGAPLPGALVTARAAARAATTDRLGSFVIWIAAFPDTLVIAQIGRAAERVPLDAAPTEALRIRLTAVPITLSDVIVTGPEGAARPLEDIGRWQVPLAAARALPAAIETDVLRSLALVPAVTFSTPLSARPIIRGYDAGESSLRIDGFEILNLYHIGRVFSAFPADAASEVSVATAPSSATSGGTLAGTVDIAGRTGEPGRLRGGADLSLVSATAWAGGGSEATRLFGAGRVAHLSMLSSAAGYRIPYDFHDFYTKALLSRHGRAAGSITAFASGDHLFDRDLGSGMDWSNLLVGGRWQVIDDGRRAVNLWASGNRFAEDVSDIPARYTRIDVRNRFERLGLGADGSLQSATARLGFGVSLARRSIGNRIQPRFGTEFVATDADFRFTELGLYAEGTAAVGRGTLQVGVRLDAAGSTSAVQPRARIALPIARDASLGVAVGRTARLFHLVTDPQAEPDLAFYDFWLNAGEGGVPVPKIDHATVDLDVVHGSFAGRLSLFGSRAQGLVELRPSSDQRAGSITPFRYGRGRSAGLELQAGFRGAGSSRALSAAYVLEVAERNWGTGWVPWSQDRRHMIRVIGRTGLGSHWALSGTFEGMSGPALTPVDGVLLVGIPAAGGGLDPDYFSRPAYIYGTENSARSAGTARFDLGVRYQFTGPWSSRAALGISVVNAGFGPVAPLRPAPFLSYGVGQPARVRYERLFDLPAVPTLTLRVEF